MSELYETDTYSWAMQQAKALRERSHNALDWDNLAEEIESLGRSEARELESRLAVLLMHLLKWIEQPGFRSASWEATIRLQRLEVAKVLAQNPGLRPKLAEAFAAAYRAARMNAAAETGLGLKRFPEAAPFTLDEAMTEEFWPGDPAP